MVCLQKMWEKILIVSKNIDFQHHQICPCTPPASHTDHACPLHFFVTLRHLCALHEYGWTNDSMVVLTTFTCNSFIRLSMLVYVMHVPLLHEWWYGCIDGAMQGHWASLAYRYIEIKFSKFTLYTGLCILVRKTLSKLGNKIYAVVPKLFLLHVPWKNHWYKYTPWQKWYMNCKINTRPFQNFFKTMAQHSTLTSIVSRGTLVSTFLLDSSSLILYAGKRFLIVYDLIVE